MFNTRYIPLFLLNELRWRNDWIISHEHTSIRRTSIPSRLAVSSSTQPEACCFHKSYPLPAHTKANSILHLNHQHTPALLRWLGAWGKIFHVILCFTRNFRNNNFLSPSRFLVCDLSLQQTTLSQAIRSANEIGISKLRIKLLFG